MRPIASNSGRAASKAAASPPTMKTSSRLRDCGTLPDTGASRQARPRAMPACATSRAIAGVLVLESTTIVPGAAFASAPFSPSITARVASSSETIDTTKRAPSTASATEAQTVAPSPASGRVRPAWRLKTRSAKPAASRFDAIGAPIAPRPMKATVSGIGISRRCGGSRDSGTVVSRPRGPRGPRGSPSREDGDRGRPSWCSLPPEKLLLAASGCLSLQEARPAGSGDTRRQ